MCVLSTNIASVIIRWLVVIVVVGGDSGGARVCFGWMRLTLPCAICFMLNTNEWALKKDIK